MNVAQQSLKNTAKVALAAMVVLFVGAIVFYKERVSFADTSFYFFTVINSKGFCIQHNRFGAFITQLLPLLGLKLHLSLKTLLFSYAISFNMFFLIVACLLVYRYKQYRLAILMSLYYFLFVSASFFWVNDEIHVAIAFMFLFFGVMLHLGNRKVNIFMFLVPFLLLCFLAISTHFIAIIPMFFLWVYFILEKKNWPFSKNSTIGLSCTIILVIIIKSICTPMLPYDKEHFHGLTHISLSDIINVFRTPVVQMFLQRCIVNYWCGAIVFVLGIASLLRKGEKLLAAWTIIACLGYLILMGITYANLDNNVFLFHIETEWTSLAIIVSTPFVFSFLPGLKTSIAGCLLTGIFVVRIVYILSFLSPFTLRNEMKEQILSQMRKKGITKLALYNDPHLMSVAILDWALPFESILLSSTDADKPQLTFLFVNPDDKQTIEELNNPKDFYHAWMMFPYKDLNKQYFNIDTTKPYQIMTYAEFLK